MWHGVIATVRSEPHWLLTDGDAQRYGLAMANAARHLKLGAAQKTIDYVNFAGMAFIMTGGRTLRSVQLARAPKQPQRGPAQVFQFVQPQPSPAASATSAQSPAPGATGAPPDLADGPPDGGGFGGDISA